MYSGERSFGMVMPYGNGQTLGYSVMQIFMGAGHMINIQQPNNKAGS